MTGNIDAFLWLLSSMLSVQVISTCDTTISMQRDEHYVGVGQDFTLTCNVVCLDPSSTVQWYHNDKPLSNDSSVKLVKENSTTYLLNVTGSQMKHSGTYHCKTHPPAATSNNVFMRVVDLVVSVSSVSLDVREGEAVFVNCSARSELSATLLWRRGDCGHNDTLGANGTLHLARANTSDGGLYYCCASIPTRTPLWRSTSVHLRVTGRGQTAAIPPVCPLIFYVLVKTAVVLLLVVFISFLTYRR